jgi:hypothetical protein
MQTSQAGDRAVKRHHFRFHIQYADLASAFGGDGFGVRAEGFARLFGTPRCPR